MRVRPAVLKLLTIVTIFTIVIVGYIVLKNNNMLPTKEPIEISQPLANIKPVAAQPVLEVQTTPVQQVRQPEPVVPSEQPAVTNQSSNAGLSKLLESGKRQ